MIQPLNKRRTSTALAYFTAEELAECQAAAKRDGAKNFSSWLVEAALEKARRDDICKECLRRELDKNPS